jgi:hypothetical protein
LAGQTPSHVVPGGQDCAFVPLHSIVQATAPPQTTLQPADPPHSAVQPPFGQVMVQVLLPRQLSFEPVSRVILQSLPPSHVTWLFTPVWSVHWLVPAQLEVQLEVQLPAQVERPSQVLVHPVPQVRSHWFLVSQW